jgi:two-component system phosphate regulon response regulator PhoB
MAILAAYKLVMANKKILILDDDQDLLDVLSILLTESGYDIQTLSTGERIFEEIKKFHPDLVLMDVMLAGMDGRLICKRMKAETNTIDLPVILISGSHNLAQNLSEQGAPNDFMSKPFELSVLVEKIENQLVA